MRRVRIRVTGRVQGVYFRASTRERAAALGLTGWVENTPAGDVLIEAEGADDAIDALIAWCRQGPPAARVRDVEVDERPAGNARDGFEIRR